MQTIRALTIRTLVSPCLAVLSLSLSPFVSYAAAPQTIDGARLPVTFLNQLNPRTQASGPKGRAGTKATASRFNSGVPGIDSLVNFTGQFTTPGYDSDGNPQSIWPYSMVGRAPELGVTTIINAPIIPVVLDLLGPDGKVAVVRGQPLTFDPTGLVQPVVKSPVFQPFPYLSGFTQFTDGMMRAQFWDRIHRGNDDNGYHVLLNPSVKATRHMQIPFGKWYYFVDNNNNPVAAAVDGDTFGSLLFPATAPVDGSTPIGAAELAGDMTTRDLATLLFNNVYLYDGVIQNCCVLGYHSYDFEPGDAKNGNRERRYVMNYSSWINPGLFAFGSADVTALSHEIAETFADPFVDNATPWWHSVDPIFGFDLCQNNLEVGDVIEVLTGTPVYPVQMNGRTYHPQTEALFSWFAFQSPSTAKGGAYSFPDETTLMTLSDANLLPGCKPAL